MRRLKPDPVSSLHPVPEYLADDGLRPRYEDRKAASQALRRGAVISAFDGHGRASSKFEAGDDLPDDLLQAWQTESYRAVAPITLIRQPDACAYQRDGRVAVVSTSKTLLRQTLSWLVISSAASRTGRTSSPETIGAVLSRTDLTKASA